MTELTKRQQAFVTHKVAGCTNKDAAIAAGYAVGSAAQAGDRLAKHPAVRKALHAATKATPGVDIKSATPKMPRDKYTDAKDFLLDVMNLDGLPIAVRADAAKQLLPYMHARMGETGKKETKRQNAAAIARGRHKFATKPPPSNVVPIRNE